MKRYLWEILAVASLAVLFTGPALAQATRTWVSGVGDDANPCSRTAPCKTYAGAISKTAVSGEINCLDPGGFGALTITKSISIVCDYTEGGVLAAGTNGFNINAPAGSIITLKGQDVECTGTGIQGINIIGVGVTVHVHKTQVRNCRGVGGNGILVAPSSGTAIVDVADSYITDNPVGIEVKPSGAANAVVVINRVTSASNGAGFRGNGTVTTGTIKVSITDSVAMGGVGAGINATGGTSASTQLMLRRVTSMGNGTGIVSSGANATIRFGDSVVTANGTGTVSSGGGVLASFDTNFIEGNTADGPNPPTILPK